MSLELQLTEAGTFLLTPDHAPINIAPAYSQIAEMHLANENGLEYGIEIAIGVIEDAIAHLKDIMYGYKVISHSQQILALAHACGIETPGVLHRDAVEQLLRHTVARVQRDGNTKLHATKELNFIASLLLLRELMHHQDIESITI